MKGCLIFLGVFTLIVLVLGGGCIGYVGYQGKQMAEKMEAGRAQLNAVDAKFPFTPAPDAKLGADRFSRFVKIRSAMVAKTSKVYEDLKAIGKKEDAGFLASIKQAFGAMKGMFAAMTDAPADLAAMLQQGEMSFAEYRWSTSRMHGTLIAAAKAGNAEAQALNAAFEDSLKEFEQGNHNDKGVKDVRAELAAAYPTFDPGELALILSMKDQLQAESPGFVVDLFALEGMKDG